MNLTPLRDEDKMPREKVIRFIWKENQWLYMVVGFIAGLLFCLLTQLSVLNLPELVRDLLPEAAGILVTITVIDQLNRRRDTRNAIKQLQEQLVRDASSIVNDVANNAVHQLRKRGWLTGDNGILAGESLSGANLQRAALKGANLQEAHLWGANLQGADLREANLQGTNLRMTNLQGTYFDEANLQGATLWSANLQEANLMDVNLQGAGLQLANLQRAVLWEAKLQGAFLREAKLQGAALQLANLQGANLIGANLQGANLEDANLQRAALWDVNLQGTYLPGAKLQGAELGGAKFDEKTILPDHSHWTPETDMTRFTQPDNEDESLSSDQSQ